MTQAVNDSRSPGFRTPGRLSSIQAFFRVFRKSCFEPLRGRRAVMLVLLALLPILLMGIARLVGEERGRGLIFFIQVIVPFYHYINMIFFIFIGCSALGESLEDRTLTYDLICPVSRNMIFSGKYAAYAASTATVLLGVLLLAYIVCMAPFGVSALFQYIPALSAVSLTTFFAVLIYGAVFISLSLLIKR
ncbi:MAG: hypothetical protein KJ645_12125, partial [Planctomycetes bacterium]|nr:hypothetical protein [Planctomycetota bacterium]